MTAAEFAVNNSYQASIQDTPFYLNYGKHPNLPSDLTLAKEKKKAVQNKDAVDFIGNIEKAVARAKVCLHAAQARQKKYADKRGRDVQFQVGESVWLSSRHVTMRAICSRKLLPQWLGPFKILAKPSSVNYTLELPLHYRIHNTFHVSMLRRYYDNGAGIARPPTLMIEGQEEFEVELILAHRPANKTRDSTNVRFLVQWKGYGPAYNSWEPRRNILRNAAETLSDYWDKVEAAVQAAEPDLGSNTGLAPGDHNAPAASRRSDRNRHATGRGRSLRPISSRLRR